MVMHELDLHGERIGAHFVPRLRREDTVMGMCSDTGYILVLTTIEFLCASRKLVIMKVQIVYNQLTIKRRIIDKMTSFIFSTPYRNLRTFTVKMVNE